MLCLLAFTILLAQFTFFPSTSLAATNLASGKAIAESSHTQTYVPTNANDGNQATYWEDAANAYSSWLRVGLGSLNSVNQVVLKLPTGWGARTQTLSVLKSSDDVTYSDVVESASYTFSPSANTVTIDFSATTARYVKVNFTANSGSTGAQISELEVYGTTASPTPTPAATGTPAPTGTPIPTATPAPSANYEAEAAALTGGAKVNTDHTGYTGSGFVDGYWTLGASTQFTVNVA